MNKDDDRRTYHGVWVLNNEKGKFQLRRPASPDPEDPASTLESSRASETLPLVSDIGVVAEAAEATETKQRRWKGGDGTAQMMSAAAEGSTSLDRHRQLQASSAVVPKPDQPKEGIATKQRRWSSGSPAAEKLLSDVEDFSNVDLHRQRLTTFGGSQPTNVDSEATENGGDCSGTAAEATDQVVPSDEVAEAAAAALNGDGRDDAVDASHKQLLPRSADSEDSDAAERARWLQKEDEQRQTATVPMLTTTTLAVASGLGDGDLDAEPGPETELTPELTSEPHAMDEAAQQPQQQQQQQEQEEEDDEVVEVHEGEGLIAEGVVEAEGHDESSSPTELTPEPESETPLKHIRSPIQQRGAVPDGGHVVEVRNMAARLEYQATMQGNDEAEAATDAVHQGPGASRLPTLVTPPAPEAEPDPVAETVTKTTGMEAVVRRDLHDISRVFVSLKGCVCARSSLEQQRWVRRMTRGWTRGAPGRRRISVWPASTAGRR
eukprot:COSAG01_NODE_2246_length_8080_cov_4.007017_13_plen_491_part_00